MFYYLNGTVTVIDINLAVIDVGGVGYKLSVSTQTLGHLELNKPAKLYNILPHQGGTPLISTASMISVRSGALRCC
jgi:Holliday junction resolvasome RuvABC DNA-binding subunit